MSEAFIPTPPGLERAQARLSNGPKCAGTGRLTAGLEAVTGPMEGLAAAAPAPAPPLPWPALPAARVATWAFPLPAASELGGPVAVPALPFEAAPECVVATPGAGTCLDETATGFP
jgi:hypothetical protein